MQKNIVIDLDDTICYPNHEYNDTHNKYFLATPNLPVIEKIRQLKNSGMKIDINSSRRMVTHNGDLDKILEDVLEVTIQWLQRYDVPYDTLNFGKIYSSTYYVDDKSMSINEFLKKNINEF